MAAAATLHTKQVSYMAAVLSPKNNYMYNASISQSAPYCNMYEVFPVLASARAAAWWVHGSPASPTPTLPTRTLAFVYVLVKYLSICSRSSGDVVPCELESEQTSE